MTNVASPAPQEYEYKAEMRQLLHLIVHSLYTHPEVFLRELISNASDALNKVRFMQLTSASLKDPEADLRIEIDLNPSARSFSVEDTGIGMTREDLVERIGTVASSGTLNFLRAAESSGGAIDGSDLIGQFGVGFYSAFMVTDEITIETRHADPEAPALRWRSRGEGTFSIEEIQRPHRGTRIYFHLKEEFAEFARVERITSLVRKYSNFVGFPILLGGQRINASTALWQRAKDDVSETERSDFASSLTGADAPPLGYLHLAIEGRVNFKALLFIPAGGNSHVFNPREEPSLHLYAHRVFIQQDCKEIIPEYLRFLRGVVDTEDLPLNVSREATQSSPVMTKIREVIVSRVLALLEEWAATDSERFNRFYQSYGAYVKFGASSDFTNRDRLMNLLRFSSTKQDEPMVSLRSYVDAMKEDQHEIYYLSSENRHSALRHPNLEYFLRHDIEVLLFTDPVDVFTVTMLGSYDGKPLIAIEKAEISASAAEDAPVASGTLAENQAVLARFRSVLGEQVEDVRLSNRLIDSAATLTTGKSGMDAHFERVMKMMDEEFHGSRRILEINPAHPLLVNVRRILAHDSSDVRIDAVVHQLYQSALLLERALEDPTDLVQRLTDFMEQATRDRTAQ
jgi:molecular chaperone HtpG